jgi:membrane-bound lytic murein transglycosylase B
MTSARAGMIGFAAVIGGVLAVLALFGSSWWSERLAKPNEQAQPVAPPPLKSAVEIKTFLEGLAPDPKFKGVDPATLARATRGLTLDEDIAQLNASQPEHVKTAGAYVALLVSETRVTNGRAKLAEYADLLGAIEQKYGVDKHVVAAIWGIESAFGTSMGERNVIRSLTTLAMTDERRAAFWRSELAAALTILERGDITPEAMTGSWAGAMGHTQFMPSTYLAHAVDFDGDGKRNIWQQPGDALASAANYLKVSGWKSGQSTLIEVTLPAGFDYALSAPGVMQPLEAWLAAGAQRVTAKPEQAGPLSLILPAGHKGPAFLTGANFQAILRYNRAVPYALSVSLLAEQIEGKPAMRAPWPVDDKSLSKIEREELQHLLTKLGHDTGPPDGIIGNSTRGAIRAFQKAETLPQDGYPSAGLLALLRTARAKLPN